MYLSTSESDGTSFRVFSLTIFSLNKMLYYELIEYFEMVDITMLTQKKGIVQQLSVNIIFLMPIKL